MGAILRKYAEATVAATHVRVPVIKAGSQDFATGSDWTPVAADTQISKDGGSQGNLATAPSYVNGAWQFEFTVAELTAKVICISVVDSATKAVEDQFIIVETYGHIDAMHWAENMAAGIPYSTALTGTLSVTQMTTNLTEVTDEHYNGQTLIFLSGNLAGQKTDVTDYDGASKMLTFTTITEIPANGDKFVLV